VVNDVTVCIPTIPPRAALLGRALASVARQDMPVSVAVVSDTEKRGAAWTRDRALRAADTEWVAFLDDDDQLDSYHVRELLACAMEHTADYVWSRFRTAVPNRQRDPRRMIATTQPEYLFRDGPAPLGAGTFEQWNDVHPAQTTVTTLVRRELALDVGGFIPRITCSCDCSVPSGHRDDCAPDEIDGQRAGEDWSFTLRCRAAGATFRHHPKVTWTWHHHGNNTSGLPNRW